jgi:hypothetical protein
MADPNVVDVLRGQLAEAQEQVRRLEIAISALEGVGMGGTTHNRRGRPADGRNRTIGGRTRGVGRPRKVAAAASNESAQGVAAAKARARRKGYQLSEETRAKMRAAQQARWARKKKK